LHPVVHVIWGRYLRRSQLQELPSLRRRLLIEVFSSLLSFSKSPYLFRQRRELIDLELRIREIDEPLVERPSVVAELIEAFQSDHVIIAHAPFHGQFRKLFIHYLVGGYSG